MQKMVELRLKFRVFPRSQIGLLELFERRHQHFGNITTAVAAEVSAGIGEHF